MSCLYKDEASKGARMADALTGKRFSVTGFLYYLVYRILKKDNHRHG